MDLSGDRQILQRRVKELEDGFNKSQRKKNELTQELVEAESKIMRLERKLSSSGQSSMESSGVQDYSRRIQRLEKINNDLNARIVENNRNANELLSQLKESQSISAEKDTLLQELKNQVEKLSNQLYFFKNENDSMQERLNKERSNNTTLENENRSWRSMFIRVYAKLTQNNDDGNMSNVHISLRTGSVEEVERLVQNKINDFKTSIENAKESIAIRGDAMDLSRRLTEKDKEINELLSRNEELSKEKESLQSMLQQSSGAISQDAMQYGNNQFHSAHSSRSQSRRTSEIRRESESSHYFNRRESKSAIESERDSFLSRRESESKTDSERERYLEWRIKELSLENSRIHDQKSRLEEAMSGLKEEWLRLQMEVKMNNSATEQKSVSLQEEANAKAFALKCKDLEEANESQERMIQQMKTVQVENQMKVSNLEKEIESLQKDLAISREESRSLKSGVGGPSRQHLVSALSKKEIGNDRAFELKSEDHSERGSIIEKVAYLEKENERLRDTMQQLRLDRSLRRNSSIDRYEDLSKENQKLLMRNNELRKTNSTLEGNIGTLKQNQNMYSSSNEDFHTLEVVKLQSTIKQLEAKISNIEEEKRSLSQSYENKNEMLHHIEENLKALTKKNAALNDELEMERRQRKISQHDLHLVQRKPSVSVSEQLNISTYNKDEQIAQLKDMESKLIKDNMELEEALTEAKISIRGLEGSVEELQSKSSIRYFMLAGKDKKIQEYEAEMNFIKNQCEKFKNDIQTLNTEKASKRTQLLASLEEVKVIKKLLDQANRSRDEVEREIKTVKDEKEYFENKLKDLTSTHVHKDSLFEKERLLGEETAYTRDLLEQIRKLKLEAEGYNTELVQKSGLLDSIEQERDSLLRRIQQQEAGYNRALGSWKMELALLKEEKERLEVERNSLIKETGRMKRELEDIKVLEQSASQQLSEAEEKLIRVSKEEKELKELYASEKQARADLEEELQGYKRKITAVEKYEEKEKENRLLLQQELSQTLERCETTSSKLAYMHEELNKARNIISELEVDKVLKQELEKDMVDVREKLMKSMSDLNALRDDYDRMLDYTSRKEKKLNEVQKLLQSSKENETRLKSFFKKAEEDFTSKDVYEKLKRDLYQRTHEVDNIMQENEMLKEKLHDDTLLLESYLQEKESLESSIAELKAELETLKSNYTSTRQSMEKYSRKFSECQRQLVSATAANKRLEEDLKELKAQNTEFKTDIQNLKSSRLDLMHENDELNERYCKLRSDSETRDAEFLKLKDKAYEHDQIVNKLESANERLERKLNSLRSDKDNTEESLKSMTTKNTELLKTVESLKNTKNELKTTVREFAMQKGSLESQIQTSNDEIVKKATRIKELLNEADNLKKNQTKEERKLEDLCNEIEEKNEKIESMKATIAEFRNKEHAAERRIEEYSTDLESSINDLTLVKSKLREHVELLQSEKTERSNLVRELDIWKGDYNDLRVKYQDISSDYESSKESVEKMQSEITKLETNISTIKQEKEMIKSELSVYEKKIAVTNTDLEKTKKQNDQIAGELNLSRKRETELEANFNENKRLLIKKVTETESQLSSMTEKFEDIRVQFSDNKKRNFEQTKLVEENMKEKELLHKENDQLQKAIIDLTEKAKKHESQIETMSSQIEKEKALISTTNCSLGEKESLIVELSEKLRRGNTSARQLKLEVSNVKANELKLSQEISDLKRTLKMSEKKCESFLQSSNEMEEKISTYKDKLHIVEKKKSALETDNAILKQEIDNALCSAENHREQVSELKREKEDLSEEIVALRNDTMALQRSITSLEEKIQLQDGKMSEMEAMVKESENGKALIRRKLHSCENEKNIMEEDLNKSLSSIKRTEEENSRLIREHARATALSEEYKESEMSLRKDCDKMNQQLQVKSDEIASLQYELTKAQNALALAEINLAKLQRQFDVKHDEAKKLSEDLSVARQKITEMRDQLTHELTTQHAEFLKLKAERDYLLEQVSSESSMMTEAEFRARLEKEKEIIKSDFETEIKQLKDLLEVKSQNEISLKSQYKMAKNKLSLFIKEREKWEEKVKLSVGEIEREKSKYELKERELLSIKVRLEKENEFLQKRAATFENEMQALKSSHSQLLESERAKHDMTMETLKMEFQSLQSQGSGNGEEDQLSQAALSELRSQLANKDKELEEQKITMQNLERRYQLETAILKNDIQMARTDLSVQSSTDSGSFQSQEQKEKTRELSMASDKMRKELKRKYSIDI